MSRKVFIITFVAFLFFSIFVNPVHGEVERSQVKIFESDGSFVRKFTTFGSGNPSGEIHVASGDVNNDGKDEIIAGHGEGGSSWVRIYKYDGSLLNDGFNAFGSANSRGEVHLAVGNFDSDSDLEIVAAHGEGGSSQVKIFDYDGSSIGNGFNAFGDANSLGEVHLAAADLDGDGIDEIIAGMGEGGSSWVRIFKTDGTLIHPFKAFGSVGNPQGEVHLAVGNFDTNPTDKEIVAAHGEGGFSQIKLFEADGTLIREFGVFGEANSLGEVHLAAADLNGDGIDEIIAGMGEGGSSTVKIFDYLGNFIRDFKAFGPANSQGEVHLAAGDVDGDGKDEIIAGHGEGGLRYPIPKQIWYKNSEPITIDLGYYFNDPGGGLTYTYQFRDASIYRADGDKLLPGSDDPSPFNVVISGDEATLTPKSGWYGYKKITFTGSDGEDQITSNDIMLIRYDFTIGLDDNLAPFGSHASGSNNVNQVGSEVRFSCSGDENIVYTIDLSDNDVKKGLVKIRAKVGSEIVYPVSRGGARYRDSSGNIKEPLEFSNLASITLVSSTISGNKLTLRYKEEYESGINYKIYEFRIRGKTIILNAYQETDEPLVLGKKSYAGFGFEDSFEGIIKITYAEMVPLVLENNIFFSVYIDRELSSATGFTNLGSSPFYSSDYMENTEGFITPLNETVYITASTGVMDVLHKVDHQPYITRPMMSDKPVLDLWGYSDFKYDEDYIKRLHDIGLTDLYIIYNTWETHRFDKKLPEHYPPDYRLGGDEGFSNLVDTINDFGYLFGPREPYSVLNEESEYYNPKTEGSELTAKRWDETSREVFCDEKRLNECGGCLGHGVSSEKMVYVMEIETGDLRRNHDINAIYMDTISADPGAGYCFSGPQIDLDHDNPNSRNYKQVMKNLKTFLRRGQQYGPGPFLGEGNDLSGFRFGYVDSIEREVRHSGQTEADVTPDYELKAVKPLMIGHGMGYYNRYFPGKLYVGMPLSMVDWDFYRAKEITYGHIGLMGTNTVPSPSLSEFVKEYYMMQQIQKQYADANIDKIEYYQGFNKIGDLSDALKKGDYDFLNARIYEEYDNGLKIYVNHHQSNNWAVTVNGEPYTLPPNGWVAWNDNGFLEYFALKDGHGVDYVRSPEYVFADGRGVETNFGDITAKNIEIIKGSLRISCEGDVCSETKPSVQAEIGPGTASENEHIFGYGSYSDADRNYEFGSKYKWYRNGELIGEGNLSQLLLLHFDGSDLSVDGELPLHNYNTDYLDGKYGQGILVDDEDSLYYSTRNNFNKDEGTIEFWVKSNWDGSEGGQKYFFDERVDLGKNRFWISKVGATDDWKLRFIINDKDGKEYKVGKSIKDWKAGEWHHVAVTWKLYVGKMALYIDGVLADNANFGVIPVNETSDIMFIGMDRAVNVRYPLNGVIDEFRISGRALSGEEIEYDFESVRPFYNNEILLSPDNFNNGDEIRFEYTPCDGIKCGTPSESTIVIGSNPADLDGNGTVDIYDLIIVTSIFGSRLGEPDWNEKADVSPQPDGDGEIDIYDVVFVASRFG